MRPAAAAECARLCADQPCARLEAAPAPSRLRGGRGREPHHRRGSRWRGFAPALADTCGNGERTILHPTTYDVCEACFVRYGVDGLGDDGPDGLPLERRVDL